MNLYFYLQTLLAHLRKDEGQDLTEYALLVAVIALIVVQQLSSWFANISNAIPLS